MTPFRTFLVAGSLMLLGASTLSAQAGRVTCTDGSASAGGRGACSGHGGIMTAAMKAKIAADAKTARKAEKVAAAKVKADAKAAKVDAKADTRMAKADAKTQRDDEHEARGATAECKDHTYSHAASHQGACSRHGGVAKFLTGR
ncbi:MAG: hypothetical protein JWN79_469 [Gemmatimonadetes bacterium]|jgi:hypothetical protein|nr:hypothetical protein [Gemmatimonadota bacterium]